MKPTNLLVNKESELRICDFGMSRLAPEMTGYYKDEMMTKNVCTRWYCPPEILACQEMYSYPVDIW